MHDGIGPLKRSRESRGIKHVAADQFETGSQQLIARTEIVKDDDFMPDTPQRACGVTADVSGSSNDQDDHVRFPSTIFEQRGEPSDYTGARRQARNGETAAPQPMRDKCR